MTNEQAKGLLNKSLKEMTSLEKRELKKAIKIVSAIIAPQE